MIHNHKYHKVYPSNPALVAPISKPTTANIESPKLSIWRSVKRSFKKKWLNFVTTVVLILTLWAYLRANELSKQTLIASHTPWISTSGLSIKPISEASSVSFTIKNNSDSPAVGVQEWAAFVPMDYSSGTIVRNEGDTDVLMPEDSRSVKSTVRQSSQKFFEGKEMFVVYIQYFDIFKRRLTIEETWQWTTGDFATKCVNITGF